MDTPRLNEKGRAGVGADGSNAFPSIMTLAKECRMSGRQITRLIRKLEASGELVVARSSGRSSQRYRVVMGGATDTGDVSGLSDTRGDDLSPLTRYDLIKSS